MGNVISQYKSCRATYVFCWAILLLLPLVTKAQGGQCDPNVPFYTVDLSNSPNSSFITPQGSRQGNCCGTTSPDRCVEFEVTLHSNALGISFDIYSGAVPSGSMFYQINCGPPIAVGSSVCLSGAGPHTVTFCKPGNNPNAYVIRSIPPPYQAPDNEVRIGCTIDLETAGLIPSTISWNDVTSGTGVYDTLLSCLSGCSNTTFSPVPGVPSFIDYEVCGSIYDTFCANFFNICDTLRVFVYPELQVPDLDTVYYCITDGGVTLQGNAYGGFGSYEYYWYDDLGNILGNGSSYFASVPGVYRLEIRDDLYPSCPADLQDIQVLPDQPATVNAGLDTLICSVAPEVYLNGIVQNAPGGIWSGGLGSYAQPTDILNNTYFPSSGEITAQSVILTLSSAADTACPVVTDQKVIQFREPPVLVLNASADLSCFGANDGYVDITTSNGTPPYVFNWNNGANTEDISALNPGNYTLTVEDNLGCIDTLSQLVTEPDELTGSLSINNVTCSGNNDGSIAATINGGIPPYSYSWSNGSNAANQNGLIAGSYTVAITDANGCSITLDSTITEPLPLSLSISSILNISCFGANDGAITLSISGGTSPYTFDWSNGSSSQNINALAEGSYSVTLTDANGCIQQVSANITEPSSLQGFVSSSHVSCFGGSNGAVDLNPNGGTPPYTYLWSNGATTQDINNLLTGTYSVTLTDANGCTLTNSSTVFEPTEIQVAVGTTDVGCYGGNDGAFAVTVIGGQWPRSYLWSNGATSQNLSNLVAGNYTLTVSDGNNCTNVQSVTINQPAVIDLSYSAVPASCNGGNNGSVDLTVTGGTGPFTYNWSTGASTQDISAVVAGSYPVTVTDAIGCQFDTIAVVTEPNLIIATANVLSNVSCNGGSNGAIDLVVSGGLGAYTYQWSNGATSQDIGSLTAGQYFVTINDQNNCLTIASANIVEPGILSVQPNKTDISCNNANDGTLALGISGGVSPYTYVWSNGATSQSLSSMAEGLYQITITDANGCSVTIGDSIINPDPITIDSFRSHVSCYGGTNGFIQVSALGGTAPHDYQWSTGATLPFMFGLSAGTFELTITDANSCTHISQNMILQPDSIDLMANVVNVSCFEGADGSINLMPTGGTSGYSYSWSNGVATAGNSNVQQGNYQVTVTDANSCTQTGNYNITQPDSLRVQSNVTHINCFGNNNGAIDVTITGGMAPYIFNWSTGASSEDVSALVAGSYSVTVTDANNCSVIHTRYIVEPGELLLTTTKQDILCYGSSNGAVNTLVSGGTGPYSYTWSNGATSANQLNLLAGAYSVTVTDANGCTVESLQTIVQPTQLNVSGTASDLSCYESADGSINLTVNGGTGPYSYSWLNGSTSQDLINLAIGDYYVTVTDANGCEVFYNAQLIQPSEIRLNVVTQNASCNGTPDGQIDLNVTGGIPAYSYNWSTGATSQDLINIPAGAYDVTVTNASGCFEERSILVNEPSNLTIDAVVTNNVSCNSGSDGALMLTDNGAVGISQISWSDGSNDPTISLLMAGSYTVTVTDSNGCQLVDAALITEPAPLDVVPTINNVSCNGSSDGSILLNVRGGTTPYNYNWQSGNTGSTNGNLPAGNYTVIITDSNACSTTLNYIIEEPDSLIALGTTLQNVSCYGGSDGQAVVEVTGGTEPYSILWSNGITDTLNIGLAAGVYLATVTDSNGCLVAVSVSITQPDSIALSLSGTSVSCNGGNDGTIAATATGGTAPYSYLWSTGDTTTTSIDLTVGSYGLTVTDASGCTQAGFISISEPDTISHAFSVGNVSCYGGNDGTIQVTSVGGTSPYNHSWSNGSSGAQVSALAQGTYWVTITDSLGCIYIADTSISEPDILDVSISKTDISCNGANDAAATVTVSGGIGPYNYLWDNGAANITNSNLTPGNHTCTVTDANGCVSSVNIMINEPAVLVVSITGTEWICEGATDGSILATAMGGTAPYSYSWSNLVFDSLNANLPAGLYSVNVNDANGCNNVADFTINEIINTMSLSANRACVGDTIDFSANTNADSTIISWEWGFGDGSTGLNQDEQHNYITAGMQPVILIIETTAGCTDTLTDQIMVNNTPVANAGSDQQLCFGDTANLSASGGLTYQWFPTSLVTNPNSAATQTVPGSRTEYSVVVTDSNGCSNIDSVQVFVVPLPIPGIGPDTIICYGDTITLTASGSSQYEWFNDTATMSCTNCPEPRVFPTSQTEYIVQVTNPVGCSALDSITVSVQSLPDGIAASQSTICQYSEATLEGPTGPYFYSWSPASLIDNHLSRVAEVSSLDTSTTFILTVRDPIGCSITDSVTLHVYPVPRNFLVDSIGICRGDTAQLTAPQGLTHLWSGTGSLSCTNCAVPSVTPEYTSIYYVRSLTSEGCFAADTALVVVNDVPATSLGGTVVFCSGNTTIIPGPQYPGATYEWTPPTGLDDPTLAQPTVTLTDDITYYLTIENDAGCTAHDSVSYIARNQLALELSADTAICEGEEVTLHADNLFDQAEETNLIWYDEAGRKIHEGNSITLNPELTEQLMVTIEAAGCIPDTGRAAIMINPTPTVDIEELIPAVVGDTITINASQNADYIYSWSNGVDSCQGCSSIEIVAGSAPEYSVTVIDENGCQATAQTLIQTFDLCKDQVFIPNTFTPNGDGVNDRFGPRTLLGSEILIFTVFDRWGNKVFDASESNDFWDGQYRGAPSEQGVYIYRIEVACPLGDIYKLSGNVTLLR